MFSVSPWFKFQQYIIMKYNFNDKTLNILRYPSTTNKSLQPWNAADEYLLNYWEENKLEPEVAPLIFNDRFGFLATCLYKYKPVNVVQYKSQEKAIKKNLEKNSLAPYYKIYAKPFRPHAEPIEIALIHIPKTNDLFRLFLYQLTQYLAPEAKVICGFMTRHFNPALVEIANEFFESVEQTKAVKKARLMILTKPKPFVEKPITNKIKLNEEKEFEQYYGVFSAENIDMGSRFFMEHLQLEAGTERVLDLASGNGVLAWQLWQQNKDLELHLLDDNFLAVESSKFNLKEATAFYYYNDCLEDFPDQHFDLVVWRVA